MAMTLASVGLGGPTCGCRIVWAFFNCFLQFHFSMKWRGGKTQRVRTQRSKASKYASRQPNKQASKQATKQAMKQTNKQTNKQWAIPSKYKTVVSVLKYSSACFLSDLSQQSVCLWVRVRSGQRGCSAAVSWHVLLAVIEEALGTN